MDPSNKFISGLSQYFGHFTVIDLPNPYDVDGQSTMTVRCNLHPTYIATAKYSPYQDVRAVQQQIRELMERCPDCQKEERRKNFKPNPLDPNYENFS